MIFEQIHLKSDLKNFAYIIGNEETKKAAVFDPAYNLKLIYQKLDEHELSVEYIIHTHGHYDHTGGTPEFQRDRGGKIVAHPSLEENILVFHKDSLALDSLSLKFFHTPGHTQDSICVLCEDVLITGDTLFVGKIGGTYSTEQARIEYRSLHDVLMELPDDTKVYPGHDYGVAPNSTIGHERETNPFLLQPDFDSFLHLKNTWDDYKRQHGIA